MELKMMKSLLFCVFLAEMIMSTPLDEDVRSQEDNEDTGEPLNEKDFEAAANLVEELDTKTDALEKSGLFEGDIAIDNQKNGRNAVRNKEWPNGTIPYTISSQFSSRERAAIAKGIQEFHEKTCVRIQARSSEPDYVHIIKDNGCWSFIGKDGGMQKLSIGKGCFQKGTVIHEFMHAAGFFHEQSRTDRDNFVKINLGNVVSGMEYNFNKYSQEKIDHLGAPYDYCSVMHISTHAFSKNSKPTITTLKKGKCSKIGFKEGLSDIDIRKINTLYKCTGYPQVSSCTDKFKDCSWLADEGYCTKKHVGFMNDMCKKACNLCDKGCYDDNWYCPNWAKEGSCDTTNKEYMKYMAENCRMSCKFC